ncbi:MAG: PIN domain-containing protein [Elusimicrobiota bacterium]
MMYLIDTNVFLEILLSQEKHEGCMKFLNDNIENSYITDFSLHSIGVILFKNNKEALFQKFVSDVLFNTEIITLRKELYNKLAEAKKILGLNFDDAYQYEVAKGHQLEIVTMDTDFKKVEKEIKIMFL